MSTETMAGSAPTNAPLLTRPSPFGRTTSPERGSFAVSLLLLYVGSITLFGKGPTYIGVPPFFWGEIVLVISLFWAFRRWNRVVMPDSGSRLLTVLVCSFLLIGGVILVRNPLNITFDALRDSAACYYALFFFVGLVLASSRTRLALFASRWKWFWILAIPWEAVNQITGQISGRRTGDFTPLTPYGVPILGGGGSELLQSVGLGCLLLLSERGSRRYGGSIFRTFLLAAGFAILGFTTGRGARVAVAGAFLVALLAQLRQPQTGSVARRRFMILAVLIVTGFIGAAAAGVDIGRTSNLDRFGEIVGDDIEGTATWRTDWWRGLWNAVIDRDPVLGLGFGDPLWEYNPWVTESAAADARPARAPHNYNMDIFARMGFVGVFVWSGILTLGFFRPLWKVISATTPMEQAEARELTFWVACLAAIWLNSSFAVLMEGPVDGIPFWLILGIVAGRGKVHFRRVRLVAANNMGTRPLTIQPELRSDRAGAKNPDVPGSVCDSSPSGDPTAEEHLRIQ